VVGSAIKVHSATTGEIVSTLSSPSLSQQKDGHAAEAGHSKSITALILNPSNAFQLISSSLDGTVKVWDYMDGSLLQTIDLAQAIFYMCAHASFDGFVFVAAGRPFKRAAESGMFSIYDVLLRRH
jgi:NET1-associated nuclear protein 1 (U3 small nucleolar RNA-associated protein 17)